MVKYLSTVMIVNTKTESSVEKIDTNPAILQPVPNCHRMAKFWYSPKEYISALMIINKNKAMQRFAKARLHIRILVMEILRLLSNRTNSLNEFPKRARTSTTQEETRNAFVASKSPHGLNVSFFCSETQVNGASVDPVGRVLVVLVPS